MEPKDRIETLVTTKVCTTKERLSGNMMSGGVATGAQYEVPQQELKGLRDGVGEADRWQDEGRSPRRERRGVTAPSCG